MTGFEVVNFGCRLNAYEAETIKAMGEAEGLANTLVFNTCAVTAEAQRQARQAIRRARRAHPTARNHRDRLRGADRHAVLRQAGGGRPGHRQCREIVGGDVAEAEARAAR